MFWLLVIGIVLIALFFIIAEILVVPGGVLGIFGGLLLIYAIYLPYSEGYIIEGHINLAAIILTLALVLVIAIRSNTWKKIKLSKEIGSKVKKDMNELVEVGDRGVAISRLTPMGKARFGDKHLEVKSYTGFVDQYSDIEIVKIEKDKIIVKPLNLKNE